jgi:hypothetical protein
MKPERLEVDIAFGTAVILAAVALFSHRFETAYFASLSRDAALAVGFTAVLFGWMWLRFLLSGPFFRGGRPPSPFLRLLTYISGFLFAVICLDGRAVETLKGPPKFSGRAEYCQDEKEKEKEKENEEGERPGAPKVAAKPGCDLISRAFEIGLVKSLGTCAETAKTKDAAKVCFNRQADEPWLHYSYRRYMTFRDLSQNTWLARRYWDETWAIFKAKFTRLYELTNKMGQVVAGVPRASHHIFTNLPPPPATANVSLMEWISPEQCLSRFARLSDLAGKELGQTGNPSEDLERIYGRMLFGQKFSGVAGLCTEYQIHWNSPLDTCQQLVHSPETFLKSAGLLRPIRSIFSRLAENRTLKIMQLELRALMTGQAPVQAPAPDLIKLLATKRQKATAQPNTVVSFQCLMSDPAVGAQSIRSYPFQLDGFEFRSIDVHYPPADDGVQRHVALHRHLAAALTLDQRTRSAAPTVIPIGFGPEMFADGELPLMRLEFLKQADIFGGQEWILSRPDLLEIYPFFHHVNHFVREFRLDYQTRRTRL